MSRARVSLAMLALILPLIGAGCVGPSGREQTLVDRATLTVQGMKTQTLSDKPQNLLRRAKGVLICPSQFRAGFFIGGEGGNCVLLGRAADGAGSASSRARRPCSDGNGLGIGAAARSVG
jgi:SH3 domain-containing YSC84-like protein 1